MDDRVSEPAAPIPAYPGIPPRSPRRRGKAMTGLTVIILVSGAAGAYAGLLGHRSPLKVTGSQQQSLRQLSGAITQPPPTPSNGTELSEVGRLAPVVKQSALARAAITPAVNEVGSCRMKPAQGISIMRGAISRRQAATALAGEIPVNAIPDGPSLRSDLLQVLQQSSVADQGFIGWMRDISDSGTCPVNTATDHAYQAGYRASQRAITVKSRFLKLWNPLAREFQQQTFTVNGI